MKQCAEKVSPISNRVLIFTTDPTSFHGHPEPMECPEGVARKSLALYYFSPEVDPMVRSTEYRARPGDGVALRVDLRGQAATTGLRLGQAPSGPLRPGRQQGARLPRPASAERPRSPLMGSATLTLEPSDLDDEPPIPDRAGQGAVTAGGEPATIHHRRRRGHPDRPPAVSVVSLGSLVGIDRSSPRRALRQLLRPAGASHVPRSLQHRPGEHGYRGVRPRRQAVHLLRNLPVADPDADPSRHQQPRPEAHRPVDPAGLDDDRPGQLVDALAPSHPHARRGHRREGRSGIVRGAPGHHHGWLGHPLPLGHSVRLQRGFRLERAADARQSLCPPRHDGTPLLERSAGRRGAGPVHQPEPDAGRLRLCRRRLAWWPGGSPWAERAPRTGTGPCPCWPWPSFPSSPAVPSPTPSSGSPSACPWPTRSGPRSTPTDGTSWPPTAARRSALPSCPARSGPTSSPSDSI